LQFGPKPPADQGGLGSWQEPVAEDKYPRAGDEGAEEDEKELQELQAIPTPRKNPVRGYGAIEEPAGGLVVPLLRHKFRTDCADWEKTSIGRAPSMNHDF
jgi:hypothetical protein